MEDEITELPYCITTVKQKHVNISQFSRSAGQQFSSSQQEAGRIILFQFSTASSSSAVPWLEF
jgi:hypothetical protein